MLTWLALDVYLQPDRSHNPPDFSHLGRHCAHTSPIGAQEFHARQKALAQRLQALNASAYIAEPGANAHFFGNVSKSNWGLSERPLLLIVSPDTANVGQARITVLTPAFEASRAKLLPIPSASNINYVEWAEDRNPYDVALRALAQEQGQDSQRIFVDGDIRHFVVDGLQDAAPSFTIVSAPTEVRSLRERKSQTEIELMKCANEVYT